MAVTSRRPVAWRRSADASLHGTAAGPTDAERAAEVAEVELEEFDRSIMTVRMATFDLPAPVLPESPCELPNGKSCEAHPRPWEKKCKQDYRVEAVSPRFRERRVDADGGGWTERPCSLQDHP